MLAAPAAAGAATIRDRAVPHYDHVLVIVEENTGYRTILERGWAPNLAHLARQYGAATHMYAETHPSEGNYVALLGGDTFGIRDDDPHLVEGPSLATELRAKGLGWRAYLEDIPAAGSLALASPGASNTPPGLYAAKHTGFTNFASVREDPNRVRELVGFGALDADLRAGSVPAFALIVPNQCNDMHGLGSRNAPADCAGGDEALVRRGDAHAAELVSAIQSSPIWTSAAATTAIVITWDEDGKEFPGNPRSCCVADAHNPGGGHIPTIVIANRGPRGLADPTPYNHYSLLRTIEDALGLNGHLRHAGDAGVLPMTPLFALSG